MTEPLKRYTLTHGFEAIIDADDWDRVLAAGPWHAHRFPGRVYAKRSYWQGGKTRNQTLHRFIMGAEPRRMVMHRNGDGLDCRKSNLVYGDEHKNGASVRRKQPSASKYRGVVKGVRGKPWRAAIKVRSKNLHLGCFNTEEEAAMAYDAAARIHFGEFATPNFK